MAIDYFKHESAYVDEPSIIGHGTKIWHFSHVQQGAIIGSNCSLGQNVNIGCNVKIGNNVKIQNNVSVYEGVQLEDSVFCGPSVVFTNIKDPRSQYPQRGNYISTLVKEGATLGANSTIVCGITIGRFAFIGAGAVVTKSVSDFSLIFGNPAKQNGWVSRAGKKLEFKGDSAIFCETSGMYYRLENNSVVEFQTRPV